MLFSDNVGWENKKPGRDLNAALKQLTDYALHLDNKGGSIGGKNGSIRKGLPPRPVPMPKHRAAWKKRTLINLYNEMPAGLQLHRHRLDFAIARAYGWNDYTSEMKDETILDRLLTLNQMAQKL